MDRRTTYLVLFMLFLTSGIAGLPATTSAADERIGIAAVVRASGAARATVQAARLPRDAKVEIECIAVV